MRTLTSTVIKRSPTRRRMHDSACTVHVHMSLTDLQKRPRIHIQIARITTTHGHYHTRICSGCRLKEHVVALLKPSAAQLHLAKGVGLVWVDTCLEEGELRPRQLEDAWQVHTKCRHVRFVIDARGHLDIQGGSLLFRKVVGRAVKGEGEDRLVGGEDVCTAIALVHVQINHQHPLHHERIVPKRHTGCHGNVIKDAKSFAVIGKGVMRASC
mmetsp:Transcript_8008/g.17577  ORF Transcript_8008/g.17577 Transcript_8008/m.17577 type:complete len:212 (-) Transcript_8008:122-757(-)